MRLDYNTMNLEKAEKFFTGQAKTAGDQMPVDNNLELDNPIRKKVEEKFGIKATIGPSDYHFQYTPWEASVDSDNKSGKEICIYSEYQVGDRKYHLGLIDFETTDEFEAEKLLITLTAFSSAPWLLYKSGRSFHGYIKFGLAENGWAKFMGRLLIANEKGEDKVVDDRWVGWCLLKGWAALRITKNDPHYLQVPELVAESNY